jgi:hypothetical protein
MMSGMPARLLATAAVLGTLTLYACGESAQEKAKAQVCSARSDISKQVTALSQLTLSTEVVSEVKAHVEAIGADLRKIKDAQPNLEPARQAQVQAATAEFEKQFSTITSDLASELSLTNAKSKLEGAVRQLAAGYKRALEPINCS